MLTFDMIRELERAERDGKKLQKVPEQLLADLRDYLGRKEKLTEKTSADIVEMDNVKNTIRRFFEYREKKVLDLALTAARTGMRAENLLAEEEHLFYGLVEALQGHRKLFLSEMHRTDVPAPAGESNSTTDVRPVLAAAPAIPVDAPTASAATPAARTVYRVIREIKEFVGPDLKTYRLVRGELVSLPKPLNDLLLKEGVLEALPE